MGRFFTILFTVFFVFANLAQKGSLPDWNYTNTGQNHTVLIPDWINLSIDNFPLDSGDWIGVFYDTSDGKLACGGYIQYLGGSTAISAWGEDQGNDGFKHNEEFKWKIWSSATNMEYPAIAQFDTSSSSVFPNQGLYVSNGLSALSKLEAYTPDTLNLILNKGWNSCCMAVNPIESDALTVLNSIESSLSVLRFQDSNNLFLDEDDFSKLSISSKQVFYLYLESSDTLFLPAKKILIDTICKTFQTGWQVFPSIFENQSILGNENILGIKSYSGFLNYSEYSVNEILGIKNGLTYLILVNNDTELCYSNETTSYKFPKIIETPSLKSMHLIVSKNSFDDFDAVGGLIEIVSLQDELIASEEFSDMNTVVTIWGYDSISETGLFDLEKFNIRFKSLDNNSFWLTSDSATVNKFFFKEDNVLFINELVKTESTDNIQIVNIGPVPTASNIWIKVFCSQTETKDIEIINISGKLIYQKEYYFQSGLNNIYIPTNSFAEGIYFIKIGHDSHSTKFIVTKNRY